MDESFNYIDFCEMQKVKEGRGTGVKQADKRKEKESNSVPDRITIQFLKT